MRRPFPDSLLRRLAREVGTPLYVQGLDELPRRVDSLRAFDVVRYAMKANSSLPLLRAVRAAGAWVDCVSVGELKRATAAGFPPDEICYTADLFDRGALAEVVRLGCPVNLGSMDMIGQYAREREDHGLAPADAPELILRVNPGFGSGHDRKVNTGGPFSKHGIWHDELRRAVSLARRVGFEVRGLHMHVGSGVDLIHLLRVCESMRATALQVGPGLRMISPGGGLPVRYRPDEPAIDLDAYGEAWQAVRRDLERALEHPVRLEVEPGRYLAAKPSLVLTEVRAVKSLNGIPCLLVDAGFHTLCRPAFYGAYHAISVVGREGETAVPTMVAGPLCESGDVFTQGPEGRPEPQALPRCEVGDLLCLHDSGAYGASMASSYNSMPVAAEVVIEGGVAKLARPRQDIEETIAVELELLDCS